MLKLAILGGGESGTGTALLAQRLGYEVFVSDKGLIPDRYQTELNQAGIEWEQGQHTEARILAADLIMKSPGIPDKVPIVKAATESGIRVLSEVEFAFPHCRAKIIGITGSNGKTTTTKLIHHLLVTSGVNAGVGGNIGHSLSRLVLEDKFEWFVLELSSFQLDGLATFRPDVAVLLNITPDHLDRYDYKMENYTFSKFGITRFQTAEDRFIFNADSDEVAKFLDIHPSKAQSIPVSISDDATDLSAQLGGLTLQHATLRGPHNVFNATCAIHAAIAAGAAPDDIQRGLDTFVNVPHRLEFVKNMAGVDYINDSKATNVDSVFWALKAMTKPVVLILGGVDKGNDYTAIEALVRQKVKAIVCMGTDNHKPIDFFQGKVADIFSTNSLDEAVTVATDIAQSGDVVLLSPACASFDLFKNYEDRGNQFKNRLG